MNNDTRMPASFSLLMNGASALCWPTTSSPPSVVNSSRRSGTRQTACGFVASDIRSMSAVAAISKFSGLEISFLSRAMSSSRICRRSSRRCAVMPSAPASIATCAARTGSGRWPPRALRKVATWSTLTPRRSGGALSIYGLAREITGGLPIDAFNSCDHGLGAQLGNNRAEMLEIVDFEVNRQFGKIGRAPRHADVVDIAVMLGDHGRDLGEAAGLVDIVDLDPCRKALRRALLVDVPAHVEPALGLLLEILQRRRLDRIDRDALAWGGDPDDSIAGHGAAVRRELDRQIGIDAADRDRVGAARGLGRRRFQLQLDRKA